MLFFSATTIGFYDPEIHGENMPSDVVEISHEEHAWLLAGQAAGKLISSSADGRPQLEDRPPPTLEELAVAVRAERKRRLDDTAWVVERAYEAGEPVPVDWKAYRQSLRDVTLQDLRNVVWPLPPT